MNLKRSEIFVYAIALMLVVAGYFNYVSFDKKTIDTSSEDLTEVREDLSNNTQDSLEEGRNKNAGDAILVSSNEIKEKKEENEEKTKEENYYASSKLDRDKMYAEIISNYEDILNNPNVNEAQKTIATQEIVKINSNKNAIMICENLILTKDFNDCVIFINDKTINVVVNIEGGLEAKNVAQIQNIISRELNAEIENIHITEK